MIARLARPLRAALFTPVVVVLTAFAPAARAAPNPAPPTPAYSPPPNENSPFSQDAFCVRDDNQFKTATPTSSPPRVSPIEIVWLTSSPNDGSPSEDADVETFAGLVRQCGGIGGRPLDVHVVHATGDPQADCAGAVGTYHPVMVVSTDLPAAWSCIVHDTRTVLLTGSEVSNAELTGAGGRLVATGSSEGGELARMLALVDSGRLDGHKVAIIAGDDAAGVEFRQSVTVALAAKDIRPVAVGDADAVLVPSLDLSALPSIVSSTTPTPAQPLDVYSFDTADASVPTALAAQPVSSARLLRSVHLYAFAGVTDPVYLATESPDAFSRMCNGAAFGQRAKGSRTTTTTEPRPPLDDSYLATARVCLLTRIMTRALFAAGPVPDQRALITALHRLPYVDQAAPDGSPTPRPNQVVNEPVRRIERTVVLDQVQSSCPSQNGPKMTTTTVAAAVLCWMPASGSDDGVMVVNVPLPATAASVSR
jgi:hypothetical protein